MLLLGRQKQHTCQGLSRRAFVQIGASTVLGLSLADLLRLRATGGGDAGSARSVILLWLWGGPAQLDTWDPKPNAPLEFRGPLSTIPSVWNTTAKTASSAFPPCNCPPTSRPNASRTAATSCALSTRRARASMPFAASTISASKRSPC